MNQKACQQKRAPERPFALQNADQRQAEGANLASKVPGTGADAGAAFCATLLEEHGVAIVPGSAFRTPDWVRISYAAEKSQVVEACRRVARLADSMAAG